MQALEQASLVFLAVRAAILLIEVAYLLKKRGRDSDVLPNLMCGMILLAFLKLIGSGFILASMLMISGFAPQRLDFSLGLLVFTVIAVDLGYYITHFLSHKIHFAWADHSVHHSSHDFDFTTSLRGSFINGLYSWLPTIPLLLVGIEPLLVIWCRALVNDYTFLLHTQYVGKLGWLEWLFNTPSHHRVHHAQNAVYIDRNFGFLLIVWDRMFGTFAEEGETCVYGTVERAATRNPLKIMFHGWHCLFKAVRAAPDLRKKTRVFIRV